MNRKNQHAQDINALVARICSDLTKQTDMASIVTDGAEIIDALREGISEVAARRRQACRGLHESGLSYQQIADRVGLHKQSVVMIAKG